MLEISIINSQAGASFSMPSLLNASRSTSFGGKRADQLVGTDFIAATAYAGPRLRHDAIVPPPSGTVLRTSIT